MRDLVKPITVSSDFSSPFKTRYIGRKGAALVIIGKKIGADG
jgi:hypothetical protein